MSLENMVLLIAGTLTGLIAGVFYCFNVAIVPALRAIKATSHIAAMQAINRKIKNPVFFLSFFGPTILIPLAAYLHRGTDLFLPLVGAALLHIVGANGATIVGNIPLNEKLDKVDVNGLTEAEADLIRTEFQGQGSPWMRFHTIRTWLSVASLALVLVACLSKVASR